MTDRRLLARDSSPVDGDAVAAFAAGLAGHAIAPGDGDYETARRIWNAHVEKHPGLIVRCAGIADVAAAVKFARTHDILVSIRGGGHNVGGRALCNDGMVIDLSGMRAIYVDPETQTVRAQGGATLGDLDRETHVFGLAVPTGVVSRTGIAGLTLGGGVGWLVRKYGFTCDHLLSCQLVTADGDVLTASATSHPDLFWALRGGGGNFGVVTSFEYQAFPVSTVLGGIIAFPRELARDAVRHYRAFMETAPLELTAHTALVTLPDGTEAVAYLLCYCGDMAEGARVIAPLREIGTPVLDTVAETPFPVLQKMLDAGNPDGAYYYWKSTFIRDLSDEAIDAILAQADRLPSELSGIVIELYGGATNVDTARAAFAQRQSEYDIGFMAQWRDPADTDAHVGWARAATDAMQPFASGAFLPNFLGQEGDDTIRAAFGDAYPRLQQIKARYDPTNFFSINLNIKPAAG